MDRKEILISLTQALIRSRSYSGEEGGVVDTLTEFFKQNRFDEVRVDAYGSVIGSIYGRRPGPALLLDGHIDTVRADASAWKHDPFGGQIENGRIYGRGASDMKGAVAAMCCAAAAFAKQTGRDFAGSVHVAGVVHEECFEGVAARSVSAQVRPDYVVIGEASELNLKIGQRGRAEIRVETIGKSAHSANPEKGVNAVYAMCRLIGRLAEIEPPSNPRLNKGIMELTDILSSPYPGASVVPDLCTATYDRRLLPGETKEGVLRPVLDAIAALEKEDPRFRARAGFASAQEDCYTGSRIEGERFFPGWLMDPEAEFVQKVKARLDELGICPRLTEYNFCTNGSHYAGEAGIRTLGFGPSRENLAHTVDEYVEIEQLEKALLGYIGIMEALLKED